MSGQESDFEPAAVIFRLRLPQHRWAVWLLAAGVVAGFPLTAFVYFPALLATNTLPSDGDSIGIPMFESIVFAGHMLPFASVLTYLCTRKYVPSAPLTAWRRDKPIVSIAVSAFFLVPAVAVLLLALAMIPTSQTPAIEAIWLPYAICCAIWCIALRSSALTSLR